MSVREKLVELLKTNACPSPFMCDPACRYYGYGDCFPDRFADHLIANGVTVREWIPVEEPPTKQGWYHVAIKDLKTGEYRVENDLYAVETAIAHGNSIGFCKEKAWPERDKLTHWCHYPQPPKGE